LVRNGLTPYDVRFAVLGRLHCGSNALLRAYILHCIGNTDRRDHPMIVPLFARRGKWRASSGHAPVMLEKEIGRNGRNEFETGAAVRTPQTEDERNGLASTLEMSAPREQHTADHGAAVAVAVCYTWYGMKQARDNDNLIAQLEGDAHLGKDPFAQNIPLKAGWSKEIPVWPYLLRVEFLAAVIVTVICSSGRLR